MSVDPQKIVLNAQRASSRWVAQRYDSAAHRPHMIEETLHALSAGIVLAESSDLEALSRIRGQLDEVIEWASEASRMELAAGDESDSRPQPGGETETEDDAILAGFLSDQGEGGSLCP